MDNAARIRQRLLAIFLPITAVLYIGGEAFRPKGTDQVITTTATARIWQAAALLASQPELEPAGVPVGSI
jgi:hypothetical protein